MDTPEDIERRLQRCLTPRGFSEAGMEAMDQMIDELAGTADEAVSFDGHRMAWLTGSAAAGIALAFGITWMNAPESPDAFVGWADQIEPISLVSEEVGVVAAEADEQLVSDDEGNLMRAWHVQVVNQERFHDPQTGHEVTVVRPRDEVVLMPVSSF